MPHDPISDALNFLQQPAFVSNGLIAPRTLAQCFTGPYRVPNVRMTSTALLTNKTPSGTYRAPGRYEARSFASGSSSSRRATWGSTAPRCVGAT